MTDEDILAIAKQYVYSFEDVKSSFESLVDGVRTAYNLHIILMTAQQRNVSLQVICEDVNEAYNKQNIPPYLETKPLPWKITNPYKQEQIKTVNKTGKQSRRERRKQGRNGKR